ncbi:putative Beta-arrestin-2 isoform 1 protein, partial [Naja naja]
MSDGVVLVDLEYLKDRK